MYFQLLRNSKMMAFLRNSSYTNTLATVKYKEDTTPTHMHTYTHMYIRNPPRMTRSLKRVTSSKPASWWLCSTVMPNNFIGGGKFILMNWKDTIFTLFLPQILFIFTYNLQLQAGTDGLLYGRMARKPWIK